MISSADFEDLKAPKNSSTTFSFSPASSTIELESLAISLILFSRL
jgi:hypothetical protein